MSNEEEREKDYVLDKEVNEETFIIQSNNEADESDFTEYYTVQCAKLAIRKEPSITSEIIDVKPFGSLLVIDAKFNNSDWFKVRINKTYEEGYCMKKFLKYFNSEYNIEEQQGGTNDE